MSTAQDSRTGVINAVAAYSMWGIAPLYFKLIAEVSSGEILIHRIVWSSLLLFGLLVVMRKIPATIKAIKQSKTLTILSLSATLLAVNWFLFIWAVNNDYILDASLGYYINPLLNVALGMIFLGEKLRRLQIIAVVLAIIGVGVQLVILGSIPIISLALAGTFACYGLIRKKLAIDTFIGLFIESLLMLPVALMAWLWVIDSSTVNMANNSAYLNTLLICAGIVTTAPLLCFTAAAKRLPLSTLGFFQYIGPSIMFLLAMFHFNEPLALPKLVTFGFIWSALAIYSFDSLKQQKKARSN
ncbi:EamA family transporter RarD [Thalassotalea sp. LPB0316]|uniref:EamA family transporter RarD n=1 Tax=Thalassotalea sp. LPB0316 TaxID=2769490 RepID=UPI0018666D3A|nr:EamA family transporter RarD [Thalassotalea sp. LPB0316]QOL26294.1 EamA family transporter RarD [Thalassotalea sp. LPB0316]